MLPNFGFSFNKDKLPLMPSIFSWIFGNKKNPDEELNDSPELSSLVAFEKALDGLLGADRFIARSDFRQIVADFADFYRKIKALQDSDVLTEFSNKRHIAEDRLRSFLSLYEELSDEKVGSATIAAHNDSFVKSHLDSEQEYLDNILKEVDPAIKLDDEQRRVVLSDEDYTLVIAGAGAGKTTLISILTGLYEATEGEVLYNDMNILLPENIEDFRRRIV